MRPGLSVGKQYGLYVLLVDAPVVKLLGPKRDGVPCLSTVNDLRLFLRWDYVCFLDPEFLIQGCPTTFYGHLELELWKTQ